MNHPSHILPFRVNRRADTPPWEAEIRARMRPWGITITELAMTMGVSRQYVWQVLYARTPVSEQKRREVASALDILICERRSGGSFGQRLRAARLCAGLTLQQIAGQIGYSWVAVERWEKDICLPKPGVLWHLRHVYGVGEDWFPLDGAAVNTTQGPRLARG